MEIERGVEFVGFDQDKDGVKAVLRHGDGREESVGCAYVAGTDGSRIRSPDTR